MKNVIISGAKGFIGSLLVDRFVEEGFNVYAAVKRKNTTEVINKKAIQIEFDDMIRLKDILNGETALYYHFAWQGVNGADKGDMNVQLNNILMSQRAALLAKKIGCSKFLCAGSIAEKGLESIDRMETVPAGMTYAAAKQALRCLLDTYCRQIGLNYIWMQFSNVFGPSNKTQNIVGYTLGQILNDQAALFGPATQPYDLLYIDDLIEASYRLGIKETKKHFYFVGSGTPRILRSYLESIGRIAGRESLIQIGVRPDDGIRYTWDMFDIFSLTQDIGDYVKNSFEISMQHTIDNYFDNRGD